MKYKIFLFFLIVVSVVKAQNNYINIPGTRLMIKPSKDFVISTNFIGLENDFGAIQIYDIDGGDFYKNAATFSIEGFQKKGVTVLDYKETIVDGYPAKYAVIQGDVQTKAINLVFGDSTYSVMVMGLYPTDNSSVGDVIKKMMLSIKYDKSIKLDPLASLNFKIDDTDNLFKVAKGVAGNVIYSINGENKLEYLDEPMITVSSLPRGDYTASGVADMFIQSFIDKGLKDINVKSEVALKIDGRDAYEVEFTGIVKGEMTVFYLITIAGSDKVGIFNFWINQRMKFI